MASAVIYGDDGNELNSFEVAFNGDLSKATLMNVISAAASQPTNTFGMVSSTGSNPLGGGTFHPNATFQNPGFQNQFPTIVPLTGTDPFDWQKDNTCLLGCHVTAELTEYIDGAIVSNCSVCGKRIQLDRIPGGVSLLRVQELLGAVMNIEDMENIEGFNLSDLLGKFTELRDQLEKEEFAVRQERKLLDLAAQILNTKVVPS